MFLAAHNAVQKLSDGEMKSRWQTDSRTHPANGWSIVFTNEESDNLQTGDGADRGQPVPVGIDSVPHLLLPAAAVVVVGSAWVVLSRMDPAAFTCRRSTFFATRDCH